MIHPFHVDMQNRYLILYLRTLVTGSPCTKKISSHIHLIEMFNHQNTQVKTDIDANISYPVF
jgi:hypothetical protein